MSGIVGIGFFIWDAYQQNYISEIILAVIYIGAVGLILDCAIACKGFSRAISVTCLSKMQLVTFVNR